MKRTTTAFLIDDDTDDHEIFSFAMGKADDSVRCVFANDGVNALEKIRSDENFIPDFIFLDMNMPRMNGKQCLRELKKIDRLKSTPVFMYSTSADPSEIEENLKLGATDFILKPADVNDLTTILGKIVKQRIIPLLVSLFLLIAFQARAQNQQEPDTISSQALKKLSVEQLMNLVVTTVSKMPEKLSEVASAVQVITADEIKRSGTLRLPATLRLATNLQVSTSGSHDTRITSRGFNGFPVANSSLANKMLVSLDGRSVYTPLFGGVYWDVQNVLQENIKQIEVISGPGGALWGANGVNGIINVITKSAKETQGIYASAAAGTFLQDFGAVQFGSHVDTTFYYRAYVQRFDFYSTTRTGNIDAKDAWNITQGGFRTDYYPSSKSTITFQGDLYAGKEDEDSSTYVNGQNLLARWNRELSATSGISLQAYFDRTYRDITYTGFIDEMYTYDIDFQHNFMVGKRNKFVWGLGYRLSDDNAHDPLHLFNPAQRTLNWYSAYLQDQFSLVPKKLEFTIGTKLLHNDFTGYEIHPTARLAWTPNSKHTIWTAVSQGVRTPSRIEIDYVVAANKDFKSEKVIAYELGYRMQPRENIQLSLATFYNDYRDLRSVDSNFTPPPQYYFGNNLSATTYGVEFSGKAFLTTWWKVRGGYTWMNEDFTINSVYTLPSSPEIEANDPKNQFLLQSLMDVLKHFQFDVTLRYVDHVPEVLNIPSVDSYFTFDVRLAWQYKWLTWSIVGQNLAEKTHGSSGAIEIPRSGFTRLIVRF